MVNTQSCPGRFQSQYGCKIRGATIPQGKINMRWRLRIINTVCLNVSSFKAVLYDKPGYYNHNDTLAATLKCGVIKIGYRKGSRATRLLVLKRFMIT